MAVIVCVGALYLLDAYFLNGMYFGALYRVLVHAIHGY
jgi:hypothetical protein